MGQEVYDVGVSIQLTSFITKVQVRGIYRYSYLLKYLIKVDFSTFFALEEPKQKIFF